MKNDAIAAAAGLSPEVVAMMAKLQAELNAAKDEAKAEKQRADELAKNRGGKSWGIKLSDKGVISVQCTGAGFPLSAEPKAWIEILDKAAELREFVVANRVVADMARLARKSSAEYKAECAARAAAAKNRK
jgi:hypothetical protein